MILSIDRSLLNFFLSGATEPEMPVLYVPFIRERRVMSNDEVLTESVTDDPLLRQGNRDLMVRLVPYEGRVTVVPIAIIIHNSYCSTGRCFAQRHLKHSCYSLKSWFTVSRLSFVVFVYL